VSTVERVAVTGGAGFIGSHVVDAFLAAGSRVLAVDDLSTGSRANLDPAAQLAEVDICDAAALTETMAAFRPHVVCHLAAQASVTISVREPARDLAVNVLGTLNVIEAARAAGAPTVFASTGGALYGDGAPAPTPETAATEPLSPYGAAKLAGEAYVTTWARLHELPNVVLRLANVYGPRQNAHGEAGVVAIFSDVLLSGGRPTIYGDGLQTRDYTHVRDVARAFALAAAAGRRGTYNIGTGIETDVLLLLGHLQAAAGTAIAPEHAPARAGELARSALDAARAAAELGWHAEVALADGLRETLESYRSPRA
jgi:UDP-glucose 4-epimerase